jgi:hypothetical protein
MIPNPAEACRKTLSTLLSIRAELDPAKPCHVVFFFELCTLFSRSLAIVVSQLFKAYLHPAKQQDLAEPLLIMFYGSRDIYEHRNAIYKQLRKIKNLTEETDLSLPDWDKFVQLVRQLLDAPLDAQHTPLILRETGFTLLSEDKLFSFLKILCSESPQGSKFAIMISDYLCKAANLPREFVEIATDSIMSQTEIK